MKTVIYVNLRKPAAKYGVIARCETNRELRPLRDTHLKDRFGDGLDKVSWSHATIEDCRVTSDVYESRDDKSYNSPLPAYIRITHKKKLTAAKEKQIFKKALAELLDEYKVK